MNLLQTFINKLIMGSLPCVMVSDVVYDFLVIHDNQNVEDVTLVIYKKKKYGLILRSKWNVLKENATSEIAALDDPVFANMLLEGR